MSDLSKRMGPRVASTPAKRAAEAFRSPSDDMRRVTVYLPKSVVHDLKQRALDTDTSMSKILTTLAVKWLKTQ